MIMSIPQQVNAEFKCLSQINEDSKIIILDECVFNKHCLYRLKTKQMCFVKQIVFSISTEENMCYI